VKDAAFVSHISYIGGLLRYALKPNPLKRIVSFMKLSSLTIEWSARDVMIPSLSAIAAFISSRSGWIYSVDPARVYSLVYVLVHRLLFHFKHTYTLVAVTEVV
jgi:hypothetical protein